MKVGSAVVVAWVGAALPCFVAAGCHGIDVRSDVEPAVATELTVVPLPVSSLSDTYVSQASPHTNFGTHTALGVYGGVGAENRALIRVDPLSVNTSVPSGHVIYHATLELYPIGIGTTGVYSAFLAGTQWTEGSAGSGATWNCSWDNVPNASENCTTTPGWIDGMTEPSPIATLSTLPGGVGGQPVAFDVTAEAIEMAVPGASHLGFVVTGPPAGGVFFHSSESSTPPRLVLYTGPANYSPVEPAVVPPLDRAAVTNVYSAMSFLLDPAYGLQWGFTPGVFDRDRSTLLRGRVLDAGATGGPPLDQVEVTILAHGEYGRTRTRVGTGNYEMLINGGGPVVARFSRAGYFDVERRIEAPWNQWVSMPDVAMTPRPSTWPTSTTECVASNGASGRLGWSGAGTSDARGNRRAGFFIPGSTSVTGESSFRLCAAEYTVNPTGPFDREASMPGDMSATTSYTYASEVEAYTGTTGTGTRITNPTFSNTYRNRILQYLIVNGNLSMPAGTVIPNGSFSTTTGEWLPEEDGIVMVINRSGSFSVNVGSAYVNWAPGELAALQADTTNLPHGAVVWRVPRTHYSPADFNLLALLNAFFNPVGSGNQRIDQLSCELGSIISCESGALGEEVPLRGTPFSLRYQSDHQRGYREAFTARFRLDDNGIATGEDASSGLSGLSRVRVVLEVAGRRLPDDNPAVEPGVVINGPFNGAAMTLERTIIWDGLDAYERLVQGPQVAYLRFQYEYDDASYRPTVAAGGSSGTCTSDAGCSGTPGQICEGGTCVRPSRSFASRADTTVSVGATGRATIVVTRRISLGVVDDERRGFGGWVLDQHHVFDPATSTVHFADGSRRSVDSTGAYAEVVNGSDTIDDPEDVTAAPDGNAYFFTGGGTTLSFYRVRRSTGAIEALAPDAEAEAALTNPEHIATDGARLFVANAGEDADCIYFLDISMSEVTLDPTRRIGDCGSASVEAPVELGYPLSASTLPTPSSLYLGHEVRDMQWGRDGLYIGENAEHYGILRWRDDGTATGLLERVLSTQGANYLQCFDVAPDGSVVFAGLYRLPAASEAYWGIYRVRPDGEVERLVDGIPGDAETGTNDAGEGADALLAKADEVEAIEVTASGDVYYLEETPSTRERLRLLTPEGTVMTVAGSRTEADGSTILDPPPIGCNIPESERFARPATRVGFDVVTSGRAGLAWLADGTFLLAQDLGADSCVARVRPMVSGGFLGDHRVASEDGSRVYVFSADGRHLRTEDALTGTSLVSFSYTTDGRLSGFSDPENAFTTVTYGASTVAIAINGMTTTLNLNAADTFGRRWASSISMPGGDAVSAINYYAGAQAGLLQSFSDVRGFPHAFSYDAATGRLRYDTMPSDSTTAMAGGMLELSVPTGAGTASSPRTVTFTSAGGAVRTMETWSEDGAFNRRVVGFGTTRSFEPADGRRATEERTIGGVTDIWSWSMADDPRGNMTGARYLQEAAIARGATATLIFLGGARVEGVRCASASDCLPPETCAGGFCSGASVGEYTEDLGISDAPVTDPTLVDYWRTRVNRNGSDSSWTTTVTPPAGPDWNVSTTRDSRGRVVRINLPSAHPICVTYASATATRPTLVRMSAASGGGCSSLGTTRSFPMAWDSRRRLTSYGSPSTVLSYPTSGAEANDLFPVGVRPPGRPATNEVRITYDSAWNPVFVDAHGVVAGVPDDRHAFAFGGRGLLSSYTSPASATAEYSGVTYTADGDLDALVLRGAGSVDLSWEAGRRIDSVSGSVNLGVYDAEADDAGRLTSASGPDGEITLTYDMGRVRTTTWAMDGAAGVAGSVLADVDEHGLLDHEDVVLQAPAARVDYGYGTTGVTRRLRTSAAFDVAPFGSADRTVSVVPSVSTVAGTSLVVAATSVVSGTTIVSTVALDDFFEHRTTNLVATTSISSSMYWEQTCVRDGYGRVTRRAETTRDGVGAAPVDTVYEYAYHPSSGRLSGYRVLPNCWCTAAASGSCGSPSWTNYTYDDFGNRTGTHSGAVPDDDRVNGGAVGRFYDGAGRTTSIAASTSETHTWDELGRLIRTVRGSVTQDFDYDIFGRLVAVRVSSPSTTNPNQRFVYRDDLRPIAWAYQTTMGGTWNTAYFVYATEGRIPDMMVLDGASNGTVDATYRFGADTRGSIRVMVHNETGGTAQRSSFDAWGMRSDVLVSGRLHPFGFAGGIALGHESLTLFGARVYDARVGRWLSKDPISFAGGMNLYEYCNGDPVNNVDPTGHVVPLGVVAAAAAGGAVLAIGGYAVGMWARGESITLGGVIAAGLSGAIGGALFPFSTTFTGGAGVGLFVGGTFFSSMAGVIADPINAAWDAWRSDVYERDRRRRDWEEAQRSFEARGLYRGRACRTAVDGVPWSVARE